MILPVFICIVSAIYLLIFQHFFFLIFAGKFPLLSLVAIACVKICWIYCGKKIDFGNLKKKNF